MEKPPIGVGPYWFVYPHRIEELAEAILRFVQYAMKYTAVRKTKENYKMIAKWAREIASLADLMAEMEE